MVGLHVVAYYALTRQLVGMVDDEPVVAFGTAVGVSLGIFFVGGLLVGRLSPGRTIQEPAVAGVFGLVMVVALQLLVGMINIFGLLLGAPFSFAMSYLGGWVGEKWQTSSEHQAGR